MKNKNEILRIEVALDHPHQFLMIAETLTRIGIPKVTDEFKELFQSCHILHKRGQYFITHFKELLALDGLEVNSTEEDFARRNTIAEMLESWGLLKVLTEDFDSLPKIDKSKIKIVKSAEKDDWYLTPKYKIGVHHRPRKQL